MAGDEAGSGQSGDVDRGRVLQLPGGPGNLSSRYSFRACADQKSENCEPPQMRQGAQCVDCLR